MINNVMKRYVFRKRIPDESRVGATDLVPNDAPIAASALGKECGAKDVGPTLTLPGIGFLNAYIRSKVCLLLHLIALLCFLSSSLFAADSQETEYENLTHQERSILPPETGPGYTINFENVPATELIKFISKIGNLNFIYDESELTFNVSIISEEPTELVHVIAAFTQVLRMNGFDLIEQGNNLVITNKGDARQIATVVSEEFPLEGNYIPPIMTRLFTVKNANPATLAGLVRPLLSANAIIEVSETTRNIIITDITQNIQEIHKIFYSLDVPKTSLMIDSYTCRNNSPDILIALANQILLPLSEGNPLIYVPQDSTGTVFIVSTPFLIEKSITILEDLDNPPSLTRGIRGPITGKNILIYHIKNKPADVLMASVKEVETNLTSAGPASQNLVSAISTMKFVKQSHSLLFVGDSQSLDEIQTILNGLDVPYSDQELEYIRGGFYIYKIKYGDEEHIAASLQKMVQNLKKAPYPDQDLIEAIESMKYIPENDSLMFTGDQRSITKLKQLLPTFDIPKHAAKKLPESNQFFIYSPKNESAEALLKQVQDTYKNLKNSDLADKAFLETLQSATISSGNRITFTGDQQSLDRVRALVAMFDVPLGPAPIEKTTYVYQIKYVDPDFVENGLRQFAKSVPSDEGLQETVDNMKYIKQSNSLVFHGPVDTINRLKEMLPTLDNTQIAQEEAAGKTTYFVYKLQNASGQEVIQDLKNTEKSLKGTGATNKQLSESIDNVQWIQSTNSLVLTGPPAIIDRLKVMIAKYDIPRGTSPMTSSFYVYKPIGETPKEYQKNVLNAAKEMKASNLEDPQLIEALSSARIVSNGTAVMFTGTQESIDKVKVMASSFDKPKEEGAPSTSAFYVYKPTGESAKDFQNKVLTAAKEMDASGLDDPQLIGAMESARVVSDGKAVMFTGTPEGIEKVKAILASLDHAKSLEPKSNEFFIYKPTSISPRQLQGDMEKAAGQLERSGLEDPELISAMKSARLGSNGDRVIFTGTPTAIEKVKVMARSYDSQEREGQKSNYYIFKPQNQTPQEIIQQARHAAKQMENSGLSNQSLIAALDSGTVVSNGQGVLFTGTQEAITRIQQIVPTFDTPKAQQQLATQYFIFKPQNQTPKAIISQAEHTADEMKDSGLADNELISALDSGTIVSQGTGVLFTGTESAINRVKEIVPTFDIPIVKGPETNQFFVYKPIHVTADELRQHARTVANDMESAGFANSELINTLRNTRLVTNGKAVLFTGTADAIERVKELLPSLDTPPEEKVKQVGKTTFIIYKIKYVSGTVLMGYLKNMASDLQRAGSTQDDLITTLNNMRYVQDTNSIVFTGSPTAVQEAVALAQKFDIPGLAQEAPVRAPTGYLIYKPKFVPGEELIKILRDFEQNLMTSGVQNKELYDVINNLRWMERTSTILVSGEEDDTQKVYNLLERFDVPGPGIPEGEPGIETVSDMSFLIYKLQYHSGDEIQSAIKLIGEDLGKAKSAANDNLVQAINTLQWIEVTNSLIATGQADALGKLKELIKSVDVPLKQVFVEVLVLETNNTNNLTFGLHWGSQGVYRNKFAYGFYNNPNSTPDAQDPLIDFPNNLSTINGSTTTPTGAMIPVPSGGDLGIIGDIILHKGQTYFALGSLINALKVEGDSTIVMNQKIITQDNKMSSIFSGQNIPYTGSTVSNTSSNTVNTTNLEYRDVGISLSITPVVGNNDVITLMIEEDISEVADDSQTTSTDSGQVQGITTNKSTTKTVVSVPDKSFLVISGTMQNSVTHARTSLPCLGGLPLIGAAFTQNETDTVLNNLVIFLRPQIIKSFDTYAEITERQEDLYRSQCADPESFDAGLELVKTPDDTY